MMAQDPYIRPSTSEDIRKFYPEGPPYTLKAWSIVWQGNVAAIAGFVLAGDKTLVFSKMDENLKAPKKLIYRTALEMFEVLRDSKLPLRAIQDSCVQNSAVFLKKLGFERIGNIDGLEHYRWQTR